MQVPNVQSRDATCKVVILCGGLGTRMREETEFRPKPLVDIGGRPLVWHIMKLYAHYGFLDFVLCLGYRGSMIKEYFLNYESMSNDFTIALGRETSVAHHDEHPEQGFQVTLAETGLATMTGGRVKRASRYLDGDTFMVTYGDGVSDVDVAALMRFHQEHGRLATVTTVRPTSRFGVPDVADDGRVRSFAEKPTADGWISGGYFVFNRGVLDYLSGDDCILEREPLERLARDGELMAFRHEGFFFPVDTYREYQMLNELWDSGEAPWKRWE